MKRTNVIARLISLTGLLVILIAVYLHLRYERELELLVLLVGAFIMWYGGYLDNHKAAIDGGTFVVDSIVKLGGVFRIGGRRSTDTAVVQATVDPKTIRPMPADPDK